MTKEDYSAILQIFAPLGEDLAADIVKHRKAKKCELTPRGAKSLMKEYLATGDAVNAAEEHLNRGWQGFKAEWIRKGSNFIDSNNPSPKQETPQQRTERLSLFNDYRFARDEGQTQKASELKRRLDSLSH